MSDLHAELSTTIESYRQMYNCRSITDNNNREYWILGEHKYKIKSDHGRSDGGTKNGLK